MPGPSPLLKSAPQQARSAETLRTLVRATEQLLDRHHFEDIPLAQILELAEVSVGSFYARFHGKDDLLPHLYAAYSADLRERMGRWLAPERWTGLNLARRLRELLRLAAANYRDRRGLLRTVALLARSRPRSVARSALRERDDQYQAATTLLLQCRSEIRHRHPELAVQTGILFALAACRDKILFAEAPHPASVKITDTQLADELAHALYAYLTTKPPF